MDATCTGAPTFKGCAMTVKDGLVDLSCSHRSIRVLLTFPRDINSLFALYFTIAISNGTKKFSERKRDNIFASKRISISVNYFVCSFCVKLF